MFFGNYFPVFLNSTILKLTAKLTSVSNCMKECVKCSEKFPVTIWIDGKKRNLSSRKYCFKCSPFKMHNTKVLHATPYKQVKTCPKCSRELDKEDFYNRRGEIGSSSICKNCNKQATLKKQREFKKMCVDYMGGCCSVCGYNRYQGALEFHHINPSEKDFHMSKNKHYRFDERTTKELDKCIILCANCHREEHARLRGLL